MRTKLGRPSTWPIVLSSGILALFMLAAALGCHDKSNPVTSPPVQGDNWTLQKLSGDLQTVRAADTLTNRLVVYLKDQKNDPVPLEPITFTVIDGNGEVTARLSPDNLAEVKTITGWNGQGSVNFRYFGPASGAGQPQIQCSVDKYPSLTVTFTLHTTP